jgi:hypothetical protein
VATNSMMQYCLTKKNMKYPLVAIKYLKIKPVALMYMGDNALRKYA